MLRYYVDKMVNLEERKILFGIGIFYIGIVYTHPLLAIMILHKDHILKQVKGLTSLIKPTLVACQVLHPLPSSSLQAQYSSSPV